ncbi:ABC transporter substrate-binding protein [Aggregatilineales bacterium SYSU G02658]
MRVKRVSALLSGMLALALGVSSIGAQSQDPVLIGIGVAQTSNVALLGQEQVIGAQIAEAYFNERGGINGRPIRLVFQDTAGDEAGAINAFQQLIAAGVVGIVGPTLSQQAFAADPLANEAGVPVIAPSNTARGIPQIGEFIARVSAPVAVVAPNAVRAALNINPDIQNVAVFYAQNDAFATSETGTFQETVRELGLNLIEPVQTFQTTDTDFSSQIATALASNPQLVIVSGLAADGGNLVKQLREFGYTGLIVGGNGLNTANIFPVCQALCDGIIIAQAYSYALDTEVNNTFREIYKEAQGKEPPQFSGQAFAAVQSFVEALIAIDNEVGLDSLSLPELRAALNAQLRSMTFDTPLGPISYTEEGEIVQEQFYVAQIQMEEDGLNGSFVFIPIGDEAEEAEPQATPSS